MLELAKAIFGIGRSERDDAHEALVEKATERVIAGTDPRLRAVGGYKRKLREPVERAIEHVRGIVDAFHDPTALGRRAYATDPQVWGFFGSADQIDEVVRGAREIRAFARESPQLGEIFAGMGMERRDKKTLAPELRGDIVERDVLRDAVNFTAHRLVLPAATEAALQGALEERAFMSLVESALERLVGVRTRKSDLERSRAGLARKLDALRRRGLALEPLAGAGADEEGVASLEARLETIERELGETAASIATLDESLAQVASVLGSPHEHLRCSPASVRMTKMGFKTTAKATDPGEEVLYTEILIGDSERIAGRFVRLDTDQLALQPPLGRPLV